MIGAESDEDLDLDRTVCLGGGEGRGVAVPADRLQPGPSAARDDGPGGGYRLLVPAQPQLEPVEGSKH